MTFFPDCKPGETLYSVCARYHFRSGYSDPATTSARLLGHTRGGKQHDLPVGIAKLARLTGGAIAASESTLRDRTILRAYLPLMPPMRRAKVVEACLSTNSALAKAYAGLSAGVVTTSFMRHCSDCMEAQRAEFGFDFWQVFHQLPGVWVCLEHQRPLLFLPSRGKKRTDWVQVDREAMQALAHDTVRATPQLCNVSSVMQWIGNAEHLHVDTLAVMVRARLRSVGRIRSEVKAADEELTLLHKNEVMPLLRSGVPQFESLSEVGWMSSCLRDERASHPLKWAVLLGASGDVSHATLSHDYRVATERISQPELFADHYRPRRARAPEVAYSALTGPVTLSDAARNSGMRQSELQGWIRRDKMLVQHWRATAFDVRRRAAIFTIEGCTTANPQIMRSQVISHCIWAVRWLEQNDRQTLEALLPKTQPKYAKQLRFPFDE